MTSEQFFHLVVEMRKSQRDYFKTKSQESLRHSRDLERRVDTEIKRVEMVLKERMNPTLGL